MPVKPASLTPLGKLIAREGLAVLHVIEKSGITRNRLAYLRTIKDAVPTLPEAQALAPVFKMTIDQLAAELDKIKAEAGKE
jgi:transcriptional regulator with XRE-family HTH domain